MFNTHAALALGALFATGSISTASSEEIGCLEINAWDCGSGAYVQLPTPLHDVVAIDAGDIFSVALRSNGQVVAWGNPPADPVEISGGLWNQPYLLPQEAQFRTTLIAAGQEHGAAIASDGTLYEWHQDYTPAHTTHPENYSDVTALAAGGDGPIQDVWNGQPHYPFLLALHEDGTITVFGDNVAGTGGNTEFSIQSTPEFPDALRAIAAGRNHALALTVEGQVIGWGGNDNGQITVPKELQGSNVIAIAAGKDHSLAVRADGTVVAWGANDNGQCDVPASLANVVAVAGGVEHSIAVRADGSVVAWGANEFGQCEVPPSLGNVQAVACGRWHTIALSADGSVTAWGDDRFGQSSVRPAIQEDLSSAIGVALGAEHRMVLKANGTVIAWGENSNGQSTVPKTLTDARAIAAGEQHSLALEGNGTVIAWGENTHGQCDVPQGLVDAVAITAGQNHSLALQSNGTVVAWGANDANQCDVPSDLTDVIAIAAGEEHSLALRINGTVEAWGSNAVGQAQPPLDLQNIRAIAAGGRHSLAVRNDGQVIAWGANSKKQCNVPDDLPPVVSVQGGEQYSIASTADGRLVAWGDCGERKPGPPFSNRYYSATYPIGIDGHVLLAAGPTEIIAVRDACPACSPGDFNRDNVVNEVDMLFLYHMLGRPCVGDNSPACAADLNHDGAVGLDDLSMLLRHWGPCGVAKFSVPVMRSDTRR